MKQKRVKVLALAVALVFALSSFAIAGYPVAVTNFPMLMTLVQQQVTTMITQTIQQIWQEEVNNIKMRAGLVNGSGLLSNVFGTSYTQFTDNFVGQFNNQLGSFAPSRGSGYNAWVDNVRRSILVPSTSTAASNPTGYMNSTRPVSILIAGAPAGIDPSTASSSDMAVANLRNVQKQYRIQSLEQSSEATIIAEKFKAEIQRFNPSSWDRSYPEQAVKDVGKMLYFNAMLQAEILKTLGKAEQKNAVD